VFAAPEVVEGVATLGARAPSCFTRRALRSGEEAPGLRAFLAVPREGLHLRKRRCTRFRAVSRRMADSYRRLVLPDAKRLNVEWQTPVMSAICLMLTRPLSISLRSLTSSTISVLVAQMWCETWCICASAATGFLHKRKVLECGRAWWCKNAP